MRARFLGSPAVLLLLLPILSWAQPELPDGIERIRSLEGITEYRLDNGLQVLLFPDPSAARITVNVTYLVGSVDESYGETGMAHLLEHMLFKGTPSHPDPLKELQDRGAQMNGTTAWERTNYFETLDASDDNLAWALEFEADRMINANVAQADLDSEMTVVRNEFEQGENSPVNVTLQKVMSTAYTWHGYGNSPIGSRADIENVPIERLRAFYRRYYQPDNAILIVAGRIDEGRTLELIAEHFGAIPRPDRVLEESYTVEPTQDGERSVTVRRVGDIQLLAAGYHTSDGTHEDFVPLQIAANVLADVPSGRLYESLVESGLAAEIGSQQLQQKDPGMIIFLALLREEGSLDEARRVMLETIDGLEENPITEEEVERVRNKALSSLERLMNNSQAVALQLSNWAAIGDWRMLFFDRDRVRNVTAEQAQQAALHYFKPSNRTIGVFIPEDAPDRTEIPDPPDLVAMLEGYTGDEARSVGEEFDPSPQNIESRVTRLELPSGIELALLPKETRGDTVNASIQMHFGTEDDLRGLATVAGMTGQMLMRGTQSRSREEIQDELARLQSTLGVFGGTGSAGAGMQSTRENLATVIRLAAEILREPSFPESEWTQMRESMTASIELQRSEPQAIVQREMQRYAGQHYDRDDIRYTPTFDEQIESINELSVDDFRRFHERFYGASDVEIAVVGDFDADEIAAVIEEAFGDWESPREYERITTPYHDPPHDPVNRSFETPDKENGFFMVRQPIRMSTEHEDYPALVLANYILGSGPGSRLFGRIRGEEGLSYGVGSNFGAPDESDNGQFMAFAIAAPQNVAGVEASFRDEIESILAEGYTAEEIELGKTSWAQQRQLGRTQDGALAGMLAGHLELDRTMQWDADLEARVLALTASEVREAMRRHLDPDAMTIMKGGDFEGADE